MRISVIIACFNAETTLRTQLDALARQTFPGPFEVLICDNGSTDASRAIAESYVDRLPALRVLDASQQRGPGHARNIGAQAARAPWLAFCDADDRVADDWLAAMVEQLGRHRFVAGRFESSLLNRPSALRSRQLQQATELQTSPFGPGLPHAGAGNLGVHRDVFLRVGGFDAAVGCLEDTDLCWRVQQTGVELVFAPEAVVHVRLRSSLRTMWRQGTSYGRASALLEHRFGNAAATPAPAAATGPTPGRSLPRKVIGLVLEQRSLGGLLWKLGWHVGHRSWQPGTAVQMPTPPTVRHGH